VRMDFHGIAALCGLPEFASSVRCSASSGLSCISNAENPIVCPRCQTCCSRVKASRPQCLRDLPILEGLVCGGCL
jgi:hypothetical protein